MNKSKAVFNVEGIHCPNCVKALETSMTDVMGVNKISVSKDFKNVHINYNSDDINIVELKVKIEATPNKEFKVIDYK